MSYQFAGDGNYSSYLFMGIAQAKNTIALVLAGNNNAYLGSLHSFYLPN
jgi:hypothetical protein